MTTERERNLILHGALVVRMVDRMMQFRFDRARAIIESKGAIDFEGPEHLTRYAEATALLAIVRAGKLTELPMTYDTDRRDDTDAYIRLYELTEGHTLTSRDMIDIEAVLAELNDEIGDHAEKAHEIRLAAFREIGGDELVAAVEAKDRAMMKASLQKALAKFRAKVAENAAGQ